MTNNPNTKIVSNIANGLLFGSFVGLTMPTQASQQHSRDSRIPQPRRNVQKNRERENELVGLTKEEAAKLLGEGHETVKKSISSQKETSEYDFTTNDCVKKKFDTTLKALIVSLR
jgi:hypothetical protein